MPTFVPTAAQRRLLDYIHENPGYQPTRDLCRSAGIPRASYYRWCRNPAFRQWFGSAWTSRLLFEGAALLNMARAQAPEKFSYWKAMFEITFDPKGLGLLAKWSAALTALPADAFQPAPEAKTPAQTPGAKPGVVSPWLTEEQWNQRHGFSTETLLQPSRPPANASLEPAEPVNPVIAVKLLSRTLGKIRTALASPKSRPTGCIRPAPAHPTVLPHALGA